MAGTVVAGVTQSLTSNGDVPSIGYITVASVTGFYIGAYAFLKSSSASGSYQIADINTTNNTIGLRLLYAGVPAVNQQEMALNSVAAYTTAQTAQIIMPPQFIYGV